MTLFGIEVALCDEPYFSGGRKAATISYNGQTLATVYSDREGQYRMMRKSVIPKRIQSPFRTILEAIGCASHSMSQTVNYGQLTKLMDDPVGFAALLGRESKVCAICNRRLTDPESVRRGIGPECWSNVVNAYPDAYVSQGLPTKEVAS